MATLDWKSSLSAMERYGTIQKIQRSMAIDSMPEAIAIEQAAYQTSATREEYDMVCHPVETPPAEQSAKDGPLEGGAEEGEDLGTETGVRIGPYRNCLPISDGITSEVYRAGDKALKVIVAYQNLEPHNPQREAKILKEQKPPCVPLLETFRDHEQRFVLAFPFMPMTLADVLDKGSLTTNQARTVFTDILSALKDIHAQGIIHRDIKPSAVLLASPNGPAYLSDFGTAWHPELSATSEPPTSKILDIGTGAYRAPEVLFGDKAYGAPVDMWGLGVMLSEALQSPPTPIFESRPVHDDGNQLGLILSIFKTLGTPTPLTWPEAKEFKITPFELWTVFPPRPWEEILPDMDPDFLEVVAALVKYDSQRATAEQALEYKCFKKE